MLVLRRRQGATSGQTWLAAVKPSLAPEKEHEGCRLRGCSAAPMFDSTELNGPTATKGSLRLSWRSIADAQVRQASEPVMAKNKMDIRRRMDIIGKQASVSSSSQTNL